LEWYDTELEIIVVDDGPSAQTSAAVHMWVEPFLQRGIALRYEACQSAHGPAAARNRGWKAARGHVVAFTDDDTQPKPDWLQQAMRAFNEGVDAAWGRIVMPIPNNPTDYELDANGLERAGFVTANCFCRRSVLEKLGGFDEQFRLAWREDTDFYFRLLQSGARVVYMPNAVVLHPVRPAPWGVSIRQQRKVVFDALLYKKHPKLYRSRIRASPRWDYYLVVLALLVAAAAYCVGQSGLAAGAAALWAILTAALCAKRLARTSKAPRHIAEMLLTSSLIPPIAVFWRIYGAVKFRTLFV
jgi:GT2 family glycosyltransferase